METLGFALHPSGDVAAAAVPERRLRTAEPVESAKNGVERRRQLQQGETPLGHEEDGAMPDFVGLAHGAASVDRHAAE